MKHTIQYFLAAAAGLFLLAACQQPLEPMASSILVDRTDIAFAATGAAPVTMNVTSDGDWMTSAPAWVKLEPAFGSGNATVKVSVTDNLDEYGDVAGPRSGRIMIGGEKTVSVAVEQAGDKALDSRHTYKKVKTITSGKAYLIVADLGEGGLVAAKPVSGSYGYLNVQGVTAEADGSIVMSSGASGFVFTEAEGGYTVTQSDGRTLYMQGTYNNFNVSDAPTAGHIFTAAFSEDGHLTLTNGYSSKWLQYSGNYSSYGAYDSEQANSTLPYLYEDSKAPSNEVLQVESENVAVVAEATSATIAVTANCDWVVRCHDDWVTVDTPSGSGNGSIKLSFEANESEETDKVASLLVKGQETSVTVTFTQKKIFIGASVADIVSVIKSTSNKAPDSYRAVIPVEKPAVVSYVNGGNAYLEDATGAILLYKSGHGLTAGQKLSGALSGSGYLYYNLPEITAIGEAYTATEADATAIPCTVMTIANLTKDYAKHLSKRVKIENATVTKGFSGSSKTGEIEQDGKKITVYVKSSSVSAVDAGAVVSIIGFPDYRSGNPALDFWEDADVTVTTLGAGLTAKDMSVAVGQSKAADVTCASTGALSFASSDEAVATVAADGTVTGVAEGEATITVNVAAVEGTPGYAAGSTTFKVTVTAAGGGGSSATVATITATSTGFPTQYGTANTWREATVEGITFQLLQVGNYNDKIQWRAAGNSNGTGTMYNSSSLGQIVSIVVNYSSNDNNKNHTLKVGTSANPSEGTSITPSLNGSVATFDCSGGTYSHFVLTNGSGAGYMDSIVITYNPAS
ncbi:MAG: Ig-like domain-containing protein [Bacteroidales bacterium]|nr:Ig-like domain-containing protein [Bacteroidales bacterium]